MYQSIAGNLCIKYPSCKVNFHVIFYHTHWFLVHFSIFLWRSIFTFISSFFSSLFLLQTLREHIIVDSWSIMQYLWLKIWNIWLQLAQMLTSTANTTQLIRLCWAEDKPWFSSNVLPIWSWQQLVWCQRYCASQNQSPSMGSPHWNSKTFKISAKDAEVCVLCFRIFPMWSSLNFIPYHTEDNQPPSIKGEIELCHLLWATGSSLRPLA